MVERHLPTRRSGVRVTSARHPRSCPRLKAHRTNGDGDTDPYLGDGPRRAPHSRMDRPMWAVQTAFPTCPRSGQRWSLVSPQESPTIQRGETPMRTGRRTIGIFVGALSLALVAGA